MVDQQLAALLVAVLEVDRDQGPRLRVDGREEDLLAVAEGGSVRGSTGGSIRRRSRRGLERERDLVGDVERQHCLDHGWAGSKDDALAGFQSFGNEDV